MKLAKYLSFGLVGGKKRDTSPTHSLLPVTPREGDAQRGTSRNSGIAALPGRESSQRPSTGSHPQRMPIEDNRPTTRRPQTGARPERDTPVNVKPHEERKSEIILSLIETTEETLGLSATQQYSNWVDMQKKGAGIHDPHDRSGRRPGMPPLPLPLPGRGAGRESDLREERSAAERTEVVFDSKVAWLLSQLKSAVREMGDEEAFRDTVQWIELVSEWMSDVNEVSEWMSEVSEVRSVAATNSLASRLKFWGMKYQVHRGGEVSEVMSEVREVTCLSWVPAFSFNAFVLITTSSAYSPHTYSQYPPHVCGSTHAQDRNRYMKDRCAEVESGQKFLEAQRRWLQIKRTT
eukprot:GHVN01076238.1.p1 GENE.GHVN01076238.1~~GHVN01076238.1.p1  ORF type:complete len:348 (+),score=86.45 GHVN01076238.1:704-1747(+)